MSIDISKNLSFIIRLTRNESRVSYPGSGQRFASDEKPWNRKRRYRVGRPGAARTTSRPNVARIATSLYEDVLKPYTFPKPRKMTAYNKMIQINKGLFDDLEWDQTKLKIFEGPLFNPGIMSAVVENAGTPTVVVKITFDGTIGEGMDKAIAVVRSESAEAERAAGEIVVLIATLPQADVSRLHAYLVFARPPGAWPGDAGEVSGTTYLKVPAP